MGLVRRLNYYRRIFSAYATPVQSQLTFWHGDPEENPNAETDVLGEYYMDFREKADYDAHLDAAGVPLLDYRGAIGLQYNPIAIAQYGLGNFNLFHRDDDAARRTRFLAVADWLVANLDRNQAGRWVWHHHFDWDYRTRLVAPWYSGLAQGQGISVLVRAHQLTDDQTYMESASKALSALLGPVEAGGTWFVDAQGDPWIEEYIVDPPTHILNGFIWGLWGVYDYFLGTGDRDAKAAFDACVATLVKHLDDYDTGYWSLYEQSGTRLPMIASHFYHRLHIVQLRIMSRLTSVPRFLEVAQRWDSYMQHGSNVRRARLQKLVFKLLYY